MSDQACNDCGYVHGPQFLCYLDGLHNTITRLRVEVDEWREESERLQQERDEVNKKMQGIKIEQIGNDKDSKS